MEQLYDRADIYDLLQTEEKNRFVKEHWDMVLKGKPVHTLLDVSIGSGNLTLPLLDLGVNVSCGGTRRCCHYNMNCSCMAGISR